MTQMKSTKNKNKKRKKKNPRQPEKMSLKADKHVLYEMSVQDVSYEYDFISKTFRDIRGYPAHALREDFCGTAKMCCEWVRHDKSHTATGVDIDSSVLSWAETHNLKKLKPTARARVKLLQDDVLLVNTTPAQIILAFNFSYQLFKQRNSLKAYFKAVHESLAEDGIFFLDAFGGYEAFSETTEKTKHKGFTYIWDQESYNPITGDMTCHIHFHFPDKSRLRKAFTYEWRLWTLPEIRELLDEAGFSEITVYWEGTDEETGEGSGVYSPAMQGDADPSWICYLSAQK